MPGVVSRASSSSYGQISKGRHTLSMPLIEVSISSEARLTESAVNAIEKLWVLMYIIRFLAISPSELIKGDIIYLMCLHVINTQAFAPFGKIKHTGEIKVKRKVKRKR